MRDLVFTMVDSACMSITNAFLLLTPRKNCVRMLVRIRLGVKFRLGLGISLNLTQTISNLNLTYFDVRPVMSDLIVTGEKYAKEYLLLTIKTCVR